MKVAVTIHALPAGQIRPGIRMTNVIEVEEVQGLIETIGAMLETGEMVDGYAVVKPERTIEDIYVGLSEYKRDQAREHIAGRVRTNVVNAMSAAVKRSNKQGE